MFQEVTLQRLPRTPYAFSALCGLEALHLHLPALQASSGSYEWSVIPNHRSQQMPTYVTVDGLEPAGSSGSILVLFVQKLESCRIQYYVKPCDSIHAAIG